MAPYYGERYYGGRHWMTQRYCVWRRLRRTRQVTHGAPPGILADIGCGDGAFLLKARQAGWTVVGTEVGARVASPDLEVRSSIAELEGLGPFGCITLWHSLEHLMDPGQALADLASMLGPDGVLLVAVPDSGGWQARLFGRVWLHLDVPRHLSHFCLPSLRAALHRSGLDVVRVWHHEAEYDWFGWIQSTLNVVMPKPNILFDALTGRSRRVGRALIAANAALALFLLFPAVVATAVSGWMGRGGTLIVAAGHSARRRGPAQ
jgi:SAM-dependent methyltransferase